MKNKMLLWMLAWAFVSAQSVFATDYYFSSVNGNDANNGLSSGAPKESESALQTVLNSLSAGDNVYLECGSVWHDINLSASSKNGSSGSHISITSYGTGDLPMLVSMKQLGTFTDEGSNIWSITDGDLPSDYQNTYLYDNGEYPAYYNDLNFLVIDGQPYTMGKYPNGNSYLSFETVAADDESYARDTDASQAADFWNGSHMKIGVRDWSIDDVRITDFLSDGTYYFNTGDWAPSGEDYKLSNHNGSYLKLKYLLTNSLQTLDLNGEWCYDNSSQEISVYWSGNLNNSDVYQSYDAYCLELSECSYFDISNIEFQGSVINTVRLTDCTDMTISDCAFKYMPRIGLWLDACTDVTVSGNSFEYGTSNGIFNTDGEDITIQSNTLSKIGCFPSMGADRDGKNKLGIEDYKRKASTIIQYNTLDSIGYAGIHVSGHDQSTPALQTDLLIDYNDVSNFCLINTDGGGIYAYGDEYAQPNTLKRISGNIVAHGISNLDFASSSSSITVGIYLDEKCDSFLVQDNSVYSSADGMYMNGVTSCTFLNNKVYDVGNAKSRMAGFIGHSSGLVDYDAVFKHNQLVLHDTLAACVNWDYSTPFNAHGCVLDSNYYYHPYSTDDLFMKKTINYVDTHISLSDWRSDTGFDTNSTYNHNGETYNSGLGIAEDQFVKFLINRDQNNARVVDLHSCTFEDVDGNSVSGSVSVPARSSKFLFYKTGNADSLALVIPDPEFVPAPPASYSLTVSYAGTGSGSVTPGSGYYPIDTTLSLSATANIGSVFEGWSGDTTTTANPLSVVMWKSKSLTATFTDTTSASEEDTIGMINFTFSSSYDVTGWTSVYTSSTFNVNLGDGIYFSTSETLTAGVNGEPSTIFPTNVGSTYHFINTADNTPKYYTLSGLDTTKTYAFDFFESRDDNVSGDRTTTYTIGGTSVGMNPIGNTDSLVTISGVSSDASGEIDITVTKISGQYGYINALIIRAEGSAPEPDPVITITASDANASEEGPDNGVFTFSRGADTTDSLTVSFTASGTAITGTDFYPHLFGTVIIPDGQTSATITITPIDDAIDESDETITLTLASGTGYTVGSPYSATITIADNDDPELDTIGKINFTFSSAYDASGWTNVYTASTFNESLGDGVYFSTSETLSAGVNGEPNTIFPSNVGSTYHFIETYDNSTKYYTVSGLDTTHTYRFSFFESRDDNVSGDRTTTYTIDGSSVGMNPIGNTDSLVTISDVDPDASGEVEIAMTKISGQYGYINALLIIDEGLKRAKIRSGEIISGGLDEIQYYPVPVTNMLNLKNVPARSLISVYDMIGHKVMEQRTGLGTDLQLNVSSFKSGIYLFRIIDESSTAIRNFKVVKK